MKYIKNIIIILLTFLTLSSYAFAQETLKIVTIERAPFVIQKGEKLTGFSIDLWKEIADYLEMPYEFEVQTNFAKMLNLIKKSGANAAISNITIDVDRQEIFDFSDSYFEGGLQIMISRKSEFNTILKSLQSKESK
jgi:polar amino acid transport system substrate-binding protein